MATVRQINESPWAEAYVPPIAVPSILGFYGLAMAAWVVAAQMAGWFPGLRNAFYIFPLAALAGGLAEFLAGMWAFRARDALATAVHGIWGAFWIGFGVLSLLFANGKLAMPTGSFPALGFWFIPLAAITWVGVAAAASESRASLVVLVLLAAAATIAAIAGLAGSMALRVIAGWLFAISAIVAWYTASGLLMEAARGRTVLPIGRSKTEKATPSAPFGPSEPRR